MGQRCFGGTSRESVQIKLQQRAEITNPRRSRHSNDFIITGYPHRMRFKAFNARYRLIAPFKQLRRAEEQAVEDTKLILQNAQQLKSKFGASTSWALGKRHIFLSEGIRQQLENLRSETRRKAATAIQVPRFPKDQFVVLSYNRPRNPPESSYSLTHPQRMHRNEHFHY